MLADPLVVFFNTYGFFLLLLCAFWISLKEKNRDKLTQQLLFSVFFAIVASIFIKTLFGTPRPFMENGSEVFAGLARSSSFPSSHTAVAFAAATSIALSRKRMGVILLVFAIMIGWGRIIANVHYPVDVLFGVVIGVSLAMFFGNVFRS